MTATHAGPSARAGRPWLAWVPLLFATPWVAQGQTSLTIASAGERALRASPEVRAAREAVDIAAAHERQAGARSNPTLTYGREQTSHGSARNAQNIAAIEQVLDVGGVRSARVAAMHARRAVAEAHLEALERDVAFETTRAYANAVAADRRAILATQAAEAFSRALVTSERRLAAGEVSGYAHRRMRLEATRYAALRADAMIARHAARVALATRLAVSADSIFSVVADTPLTLPDESGPVTTLPVTDSLVRLALAGRPDLRAALAEVDARRAEAGVAARERVPMPAFSVGFKNERVTGADVWASGLVAGLSLPLPLFDRRAGAMAAAEGESRRADFEVDVVRRRIVREVADAADAYTTLAQQLNELAPRLGEDADGAVRAVNVAYEEGEATLLEWLDAVRAHQEAQALLATLRSEFAIRRASLDRVTAAPRSPSSPRGSDAPDQTQR